jgi:hypothetical protein
MSYVANIDMHDIATRLYAIEPKEWQEQVDDYKVYICRNGIGSYCGYVSLPTDHPFYTLGYDDMPIKVHCGLTFKGDIFDDVYIGFDCAHYCDYTIGTSRIANFGGTYRCFDYVRTECLSVLFQLKWYEKSR